MPDTERLSSRQLLEQRLRSGQDVTLRELLTVVFENEDQIVDHTTTASSPAQRWTGWVAQALEKIDACEVYRTWSNVDLIEGHPIKFTVPVWLRLGSSFVAFHTELDGILSISFRECHDTDWMSLYSISNDPIFKRDLNELERALDQVVRVEVI